MALCFSEIYMKRSNLRKRQLAGLGGFGMVFGRTPNLEQVEPVLFFQLVIDEDPRAVFVLIGLALAFVLPAARPVKQSFGTARDRTDHAGEVQYAVSAGGAFLQECPGCVDSAHEKGIASDADLFIYS